MASPDGCRICAGRLELVRRGSDAQPTPDQFAPANHGRGKHGDLYRCRECGTVQQPSLPGGEQLHELYRRMRDDSYLGEEQGRRAAARRLLDKLAPHAGAGRLLDVGCGYGLFLDEARQRGYEVVGIELSSDCARYAREVLGLSVLESSLDQAGFERGSFDAIVMTDVFEHLDDPAASLDLCGELLGPDGALMLTTPDPSSWTARLAGPRWWSYLPAHKCLVPRATVRELLLARGLVAAAEHPYVRVFSSGYWLAGLGERGGPLAACARTLSRCLPHDAMLAAAMGDDWTYIVRRIEVLQPPRMLGGPLKVHAVIPAHNAERTIARVAQALPVEAIDRALVVDDASSDGTIPAALAAGLEVLPHPVNRGYGANQKSCYVRAALDGADIVVMVHGDNQYDPVLVPEMTRKIEEGQADVVIGSRLLQDEAIAGGMPRWKWIGNRALTEVENVGFRRNFSEYHTGYRAFSMRFLRSIAFLRNSDGFAFDQEIFAQIVASETRVRELAIPTRYFLEASSVSFRESVRYGLRTLLILFRFRRDPRRQRWPLLRRPAVSLRPRLAPEVQASTVRATEAALEP